ncbi:MAG: glycosyltransferase family 2 protein [Patescibacteria group bacterium]
MLSQLPSISIIIVNYNGKHLLDDCLKSVFKLSYPKNKLEIILVDNASTDGSSQYVTNEHSSVKVLPLETNTGFTGGNNAGIKQATGEYIVLLNNDTVVTKNWLKELVMAAKPEQVGIVSSKLLLDVPFVELSLSSSLAQYSEFTNSTDFSPRGALIENITAETNEASDLIWYECGFTEPVEMNGVILRWITAPAKILLPITAAQNQFHLTLHGYPTNQQLHTVVTAKVGDKNIFNRTLQANEVVQEQIFIKSSTIKNKLSLVQNAGNELLHNGYGKDRGNITRIAEKKVLEHYEKDSPYFQQTRAVSAACGAACLIKRAVIDQIGELDDRYFMYYEDLEFSVRAWRAGWNSVYAPKAIVYHKHRATTGKISSSFFITMTEKNHLFLVLTHFPADTALRELMLFFIRVGVTVLKQQVFRFRKWELYQEYCQKSRGRIEAAFALNKHFFELIRNRFWWNSHSTRSFSELEKQLY